MKAEELRIGNWVDDEYNPTKVDANLIKKIYDTEKDIKAGFDIVRQYKPIPITEEWLARLGFWAKNKRGISVSPCCDFAYRDNGSFWHHSEVDGSCSLIKYRGIDYIHQLQNLYFALTGEELNQEQ